MRRAAILSTCVLVAACGSGAKRLTRDEYANRANVICARFNKAVGPASNVTNVHRVAALARRTELALDGAQRALRRLKPPREEEAEARRWVASMSRLRVDVRRIRERAEANDLAGIRRVVTSASRDDAETNRLARALGATVCVPQF